MSISAANREIPIADREMLATRWGGRVVHFFFCRYYDDGVIDVHVRERDMCAGVWWNMCTQTRIRGRGGEGNVYSIRRILLMLMNAWEWLCGRGMVVGEWMGDEGVRKCIDFFGIQNFYFGSRLSLLLSVCCGCWFFFLRFLRNNNEGHR